MAAARWPARKDPANSQFFRPRATGRIWCCASQFVLVASQIVLVPVNPLILPALLFKFADHPQEVLEVLG